MIKTELSFLESLKVGEFESFKLFQKMFKAKLGTNLTGKLCMMSMAVTVVPGVGLLW